VSRRALLAVALALVGAGCSTVDPEQLQRVHAGQLQALADSPAVRGAPPRRVVVLPVVDARTRAEPGGARAPMTLEAALLQQELAAALGRVLGTARVDVAPVGTATAAAYARGDDLLVAARVVRWDAVYLGTNGWWVPNALAVATFFWPIGPQWLIADEVFGVDAEVELDVLAVAAERPLPTLEQRRVRVRSPAVGDPEPRAPTDVLPAPALDLDDLDRGLDLFGTWLLGDLDPDQWEKVGAAVEPHARRVASLRAAATIARGVIEFEGLAPAARARALATTHAVLAGVATYDRAPPCLAADVDAHALAALLVGDAGAVGSALAPRKNVRLLVDHQASAAAIGSALDALAGRCRPEDTLVLGLAGRGGLGSDGPGLLDPAGEVLSLARLAAVLRASRAGQRLVVLDLDLGASEGGGPRQGSARAASDVAPALAALLDGADAGLVVLATSLGPGEQAQPFEGQGLLTRFVLRGLAGEADRDEDGLTWGDLAEHLRSRVPALADVALPAPQRPLVVVRGEVTRVR